MIQKLFSFVHGDCSVDNSDSPMNQEVLLGGHLYQIYLKEKLQDWLVSIRAVMQKELKMDQTKKLSLDGEYFWQTF
jgi:DNA-directed RNA polymerase I subunit RPA2